MKRFPEQKKLTKNDYLIICGDFGAIWDNSPEEKYWIKWLTDKSFTTLFIDGNHENFDLLDQYKISLWNGGKVHKITESVYHLMRGQVFTIDGIKIFTMGGASSHDKDTRVEFRSWWKQEMPNDEEYNEALANLDKTNWEVDVVISHCAPDSIQRELAYWYEHDRLTNFLETVIQDLKFSKHYFGHYHTNKNIDNKYFALYSDIKKLNLEGD